MRKPLLALTLSLLVAMPVLALNDFTHYKSGISLIIGGARGTDWVFERYYHDPLIDDRGVIYITSGTQLGLEHNAMNRLDAGPVIGINGQDGVPDSGDEGIIRYKVDMDWNWKYTWSDGRSVGDTPESKKCPRYTAPFSFATLVYFDGTPVLGSTGPSSPIPPYPASKTETFYFRGLLDEFGDQWHIITVGDDDSWQGGFYDHWSSDGKIFRFVVNPVTPAINFSKLNADARWYTTPAKAYFVPKLHSQTTYLTGGIAFELVNITDGQPVLYRIDETDGSTWHTYSSAVDVGALSLSNDTVYTLRYKIGSTGPQKVRKLHYNPAFPSDAEQHPSKVLWRNANDQQRTRYLIANNATYSGNFNQLLGPFRGGHGTYAQPLMTGSRLVKCGVFPANNAFTVFIDGFGAHALQEQLARDYTLDNALNLDPIGHERSHNDANPCRERVYHGYYFTESPVSVALAYDLLISTWRKPAYANGFTAIEDYKIRDNLASFAMTTLQLRSTDWPNRGTVSGWNVPNGYYAGMWGTARELGLQLISMIMPGYDTAYYGTSGADGTAATHPWTPYPDTLYSWWSAGNSKETGSGIYHLVTDEATPRWQDREGYWGGDMMGQWFYYVSNARANFEGHHFPHLEAAYQLAMDNQLRALKVPSGDDGWVQHYTCLLINENFPDLVQQEYDTLNAGTAISEKDIGYSMWYHGVYGLCYTKTDWQDHIGQAAITLWEVLAPHGAAGEVAVAAGAGYVEPRNGGISKLRLTAGGTLDPATINNGVISITGLSGGNLSHMVSQVTLTGGGTVIVVDLSAALPDADRYTIGLADTVKTLGGNDVTDRTAEIAALAGDVDSSGAVAPADMAAVRSQAGAAVGSATGQYDVDGSGAITPADMLAVRRRLGQSLP